MFSDFSYNKTICWQQQDRRFSSCQELNTELNMITNMYMDMNLYDLNERQTKN